MTAFKNQEMTDSELLEKISTGNQSAWEKLALRYEKTIYGLAYHITGNAENASDTMQNALIRIRRYAKGFKYGENAEKWIKTITIREALTVMKHKNRLNRLEKKEVLEREQIKPASPSENIGLEEVVHLVRNATEKLPDIIRSAVVMHFASDMTHKDIGKEMKVDSSVVSRRIKKGLGLLKQHLMSVGVVDAFALAPVFLGDALSRKAVPEGLLQRVLQQGSGVSPSSFHHAAQSSGHVSKWMLAAVSVVVVTGGVVLMNIMNKQSSTTPLEQAVSTAQSSFSAGDKTTGVNEVEILFEDDFESGLGNWRVRIFTSNREEMKLSLSERRKYIRIEKVTRDGVEENCVVFDSLNSDLVFMVLSLRKSISETSLAFEWDFCLKETKGNPWLCTSNIYYDYRKPIARPKVYHRQKNALSLDKWVAQRSEIKLGVLGENRVSFLKTMFLDGEMKDKVETLFGKKSSKFPEMGVGIAMSGCRLVLDNIRLTRLSDQTQVQE